MKMRKMKKVLVMVLVIIMALGAMTACGGDKKAGGEDMVKIGIVQIVDHPSLNTIRDSTIDQLAEEGYIDGETAEISVKDAQNEQNMLKSICQEFSTSSYDIIIPIATPTAQAALGETTEIPIVFSAITDPVGAGLMTDLNKPGGNITGVSDKVSAAKIMDIAMLISPDIKTIGALYTTSEANSQAVIEELKVYAKENNLKLVEKSITKSDEIQQAASQLAGSVDAVFSPIDNTVASAMPVVVETFKEAKIPFYVGADSMVNDGGLATDGINYSELGKETGKMAARVLEGEDPGQIPVLIMEETQYYINENTAKEIGITIPKDILDKAIKLGSDQ